MKRIGFDDEDPFRDLSDELNERHSKHLALAEEVAKVREESVMQPGASISFDVTVRDSDGNVTKQFQIDRAPFGIFVAPVGFADIASAGIEVPQEIIDAAPPTSTILAFSGLHSKEQLVAVGCTVFATLASEGVLAEVAMRHAVDSLHQHSAESTSP